jgi:SsrA-binding protein
MKNNSPEISNRKAGFEYAFIQKFEAGMVLRGSEIKSIRDGKVNMGDAYCVFLNGELYVKNLHISEYKMASYLNHEPLRERKLLLKKNEIKKLSEKIKNQGVTIVPTRLFFNAKGFAKLEIALATGKKLYDKRESLKEKSVKREIDRSLSE